MSDPAQRSAIAVGCDHAGFSLKRHIAAYLIARGERVEDFGTHDESSCDYPDFAHRVAESVATGRCQRGVLVCGTGLGMSYAANRHAGVRAAVCTEAYAARMAREHNDANVLCLGARIVGVGLAEDIVRVFFETAFEGGRHVRRVEKIEPSGG